jgi:hypothetical protein
MLRGQRHAVQTPRNLAAAPAAAAAAKGILRAAARVCSRCLSIINLQSPGIPHTHVGLVTAALAGTA